MSNLSYPAWKYLCQTFPPPPPHHFGSKGLGLGHGLDIVFAVFFGKTISSHNTSLRGRNEWKIDMETWHKLHVWSQLALCITIILSNNYSILSFT